MPIGVCGGENGDPIAKGPDDPHEVLFLFQKWQHICKYEIGNIKKGGEKLIFFVFLLGLSFRCSMRNLKPPRRRLSFYTLLERQRRGGGGDAFPGFTCIPFWWTDIEGRCFHRGKEFKQRRNRSLFSSWLIRCVNDIPVCPWIVLWSSRLTSSG